MSKLSLIKKGLKFIPKKIPKVEIPKVKIPKVSVPKVSNIPTKKILKAGAVGGGAYLGYKAITGAGNAIDRTFNPPLENPQTLPDIPSVPTGWTPEDMTNFFRGINPQDERVGGWEELGGGLGGAAEAIPKAVGENILLLSALAGIVIIVSQRKRKNGKK